MKVIPNKKLKQHILPFILIAAIAIIISAPHLNEPPAYVHAWSQADNYSLAIGFTHNNCDLFHPQTLIYNKQQKGFDDPLSLVTACDLPLPHWVAGILMSITGSTQPWVFRSLTLTITILGLWLLYLLALVLTNSVAKSLLASIFMATAPSFAYYSSSFLPTLPSLSFAIGGVLFYVLYTHDDKTWKLHIAIILLTLAMMMRTSFAVLWVAVACFQTLRILRKETSWRSSWLPFVIGIVLFSSWWLWNIHLRQEYGSLFLGTLLPARNMEEVRSIFQNVHDRWEFHYFQRIQHWLFAAVALGAVITLIINKKQIDKKDKKLSLWWLLSIWFFGEILFATAMLRQYSDHDYYFLDSFFLPIVISLVGLLGILPNTTKRWVKVAGFAAVLFFTYFMTVESCNMQKERRTEYVDALGVDALETAVRYKSANLMLEESGYGSQQLRFLTLFAYPQNTPFTMMNREGYAVMRPKPDVVAHALTFDYDYILIEDEVYRREFQTMPEILSRLQRLAGNGEISVCSLSDSVLHHSPEHFFE